MTPSTENGVEFDPEALDRTERRFWADICDAAPAAVAAAYGVRRADFGAVQTTVASSLAAVPELNLILGAADGDAAAEGFLAEAIEWTRAEGTRAFALLSPDRPGTAAAEAALSANGFERAAGWMRFVRDPHPPRFEARDEVEVVEIGGETEAAPFGTIVALGFGLPSRAASIFAPVPGLPDWRCYLARIDGEPQACAAMLVDGEVAMLGIAATLEADRRRGCRPALLRRRIEDAAAAGVRTLFVDSGERVPGRPSTSYADILRAGFEEAYVRPGWVDARLPAR
jgi:hypothetical protein